MERNSIRIGLAFDEPISLLCMFQQTVFAGSDVLPFPKGGTEATLTGEAAVKTDFFDGKPGGF